MGNALEKAEKAAKKAIESTYKGIMTVIEYKKVKDPITALTSYKEVVVSENQPCSLSFESITAAVQTETVATISQAVKLFLSPDVSIKVGSKIIVTQSGITAEYSNSGVPAIYPTHQEIILKLFEGWT